MTEQVATLMALPLPVPHCAHATDDTNPSHMHYHARQASSLPQSGEGASPSRILLCTLACSQHDLVLCYTKRHVYGPGRSCL